MSVSNRSDRSGWPARALFFAAALASLFGVRAVIADDVEPIIERISVAFDGGFPDRPCLSPSISGDGRFVAFVSAATNLVRGVANAKGQIFVWDRLAKRTELISAAFRDPRAPGNEESLHPAISPDGRFVAFESAATNLVPGVLRGQRHVFVRDRLIQRTELMSVAANGRDEGDGPSRSPAISAADAQGGFWVAFESDATNLIDRPDPNPGTDIFVRRRDPVIRENRRTAIVSVRTERADSERRGSYTAPSISHDGRTVKFELDAGRVYPGADGGAGQPGPEVLVWDQERQKEELRNLRGSSAPVRFEAGSSVLSGDGLVVGFVSREKLVDRRTNDPASFLDVFVNYRSEAGTLVTIRVSRNRTQGVADGDSRSAGISFGGRYVAFRSDASDLVESAAGGGPRIFVRDLDSNVTRQVGVIGSPEDGASDHPVISADGRFVVFESEATNLTDETATARQAAIYLAPNPVYALSSPTIHDVDPAFAPSGTSAVITVSGAGFQPDTTASLGPRIDVKVTQWTPTHLVLCVEIPSDAGPGLRDLTVTTPRLSPTTQQRAFAVTSGLAGGRIGVKAPTFDDVAPGHFALGELVVSNRGEGSLAFALGMTTGSFLLADIRRPFILEAGKDTRVPLLFAPTASGTHQGTVTVCSDDATNRDLKVPLTGTSP